MARRNYESFAYCNNCSRKYMKDMLWCCDCKQKLRHRAKSASAKRTEVLYARL